MGKVPQALPLISVIIAVHNQEKFIGRCLRSLLNQSMRHEEYEIIVVDDGSSDRTPYALELFHNAIVAIRSDKNKGLPASLNKGIKISKGKYVVRVDSDDYVNHNFLNFLFTFLEVNEKYHAVSCDYLLVSDSEDVIARMNSHESPIACGILFNKQSLLDIGLYDEDFKCHEERDLRIRFEKKYRIGRLEIPLYRYRRHEDNMTNNKKLMDQHARMLEIKHGFINDEGE